jgi:hypothetical protein
MADRREIESERDREKGTRDKIPHEDLSPVMYFCQLDLPKISRTSQNSTTSWVQAPLLQGHFISKPSNNEKLTNTTIMNGI